MIARVWSARTTRDRAAQYAAYLRAHVLEELRGIEGYQRAMLLERSLPTGDENQNEHVEVQVITFWRSLDAISAFSGADLEAAVVTDEAAALLVAYERRVRHYEVVLESRDD